MFHKYSISSKKSTKCLVVGMIKFMDRKNSSQNFYHRIATLCIHEFINPVNKKHEIQKIYLTKYTELCYNYLNEPLNISFK